MLFRSRLGLPVRLFSTLPLFNTHRTHLRAQFLRTRNRSMVIEEIETQGVSFREVVVVRGRLRSF